MATFRLARRLRCARAADSMSDAQLAVLADLRMNGRRTVSTLAERERVTAPSMTSTINGLEEQGYVVRTPDEDDRRRAKRKAKKRPLKRDRRRRRARYEDNGEDSEEVEDDNAGVDADE